MRPNPSFHRTLRDKAALRFNIKVLSASRAIYLAEFPPARE